MSAFSIPPIIKQVITATGIAAVLIIISVVHLSHTRPPTTEFDHWKLRPSIDTLTLADTQHDETRLPTAAQ
jgi:hypothetical protein